jgi:cold shock CspA family protein
MSFTEIIEQINSTESEREKMFEGKVVTWKLGAGYGFIERSDGERPNIFCHAQQLATGGDSLAIGTRVRFDIATNLRNGKLHATNVTPI